MTDRITNQKQLSDIIFKNNISLNFLKSSIGNEDLHNSEFNYNNLFWKFDYTYENFFHILQKTEKELLELRVVGETTIHKLRIFLNNHNCSIGMFSDFNSADFYTLIGEKTRLEDLTPEEKNLSLVLIQCLVKQYGNDMELGREIRKIFNELKP
jgi:hypothetical protein